MQISEIRHPLYDEYFLDWTKWRFCYEGGQRFIDRYLTKFSRREKHDDFLTRKKISYSPSFAKTAVQEIKNAIFQRMCDISRSGGSESYQKAIEGLNGGVDLLGSSMNSFIGMKILPELLTMSKVGIFVDMPIIDGPTIIHSKNKNPYLYLYKAEDIKSWTLSNPNEFSSLLVKDHIYTYDKETGLPNGSDCRYRYLYLNEEGTVTVIFYDENDKIVEESILNINKIPFVVANLSHSLLTDVANYQISLLNLASSDIAYSLNCNYPFYTEQYDPRTDSEYIRHPSLAEGGQENDAQTAKNEEVKTGISQGRKYPKGLERPAFINPSPEPLRVSMEKQEQLKQEIRQLVHLAVSSLMPKMASAESKAHDEQGLKSGLAYIGLELERVERIIATYWSMYENSPIPTINYPENYDIRSEAQIREEVKQLKETLPIVPSQTFQREIGKEISRLLLGRKVSREIANIIEKEIDDAPAMSSDPDAIAKDVEIGLVDLETASKIRGYPNGSVEKAKDDHAERLARISEAQSKNDGQARGVSDQGADLGAGKKEKKESLDTSKDPVVKNKQRGKGK